MRFPVQQFWDSAILTNSQVLVTVQTTCWVVRTYSINVKCLSPELTVGPQHALPATVFSFRSWPLILTPCAFVGTHLIFLHLCFFSVLHLPRIFQLICHLLGLEAPQSCSTVQFTIALRQAFWFYCWAQHSHADGIMPSPRLPEHSMGHIVLYFVMSLSCLVTLHKYGLHVKAMFHFYFSFVYNSTWYIVISW